MIVLCAVAVSTAIPSPLAPCLPLFSTAETVSPLLPGACMLSLLTKNSPQMSYHILLFPSVARLQGKNLFYLCSPATRASKGVSEMGRVVERVARLQG